MAGKRIVALGLFALVALTIGLFAASGTEAQSYKPQNTYTVVNPAAGVATNNTMILTIPAPGYNYEDSSMYSFTPVDWWTPMGSELPFGAMVGTLSSSSTLGLFNAQCYTDVMPVFNLYNATTDTSNQLTQPEMAWTNTNNPIPFARWDPTLPDYLEGYPAFVNIMLDPDGPAGPQPPLRPRARYAGDQLVAGNNMLIQVIILSPGQIAQLPGIKTQMVAGMGYAFLTSLNNPVDQEEKPGSVSDFCTPLNSTTTFFGTTTGNQTTGAVNDGCPAVGVAETGTQCTRGDPTDAEEDGAPDKINDGCPQVGATAETGDQCNNNTDDDVDPPIGAGFTGTKNPVANSGVLASGMHIQRNFSQSERDADNDAFENDLDPCPLTPDPLWVPRVACVHPGAGDHDCDGLPDSCDPTPEVDNNSGDHDFDGYNNRQDICPLVKNGCKIPTPQCSISDPTWDNQADNDSYIANADLGPSPDSIGDACDDSDGDTIKDAVELGQCRNDTDDDPVNDGTAYGTWINDGCPAKGTAETDCGPNEALPLDDDADTRVNDGCATKGTTAEAAGVADGSEALIWGTNPGTGLYYQGMAWAGVCIGVADTDGDGYCDALENALGSSPTNGPEYNECVNAVTDDADTVVNDGCPVKASFAENDVANTCALPGATANCGTAAACAAADAIDDDADTYINDGCPADGAAELDQCANAVTDDADAYVNDGCPKVGDYVESGAECAIGDNDSDDTPTPDNRLVKGEVALGVAVNDGCPAVGVPESLVIDAVINAPGAVPAGDVLKSCNDGVDNDNDTKIDTQVGIVDPGCDTSTYTGDGDEDGNADVSDNCGSGINLVWNPEQRNTEALLLAGGAKYPAPAPLPTDALGDVCDPDDDNDGFTDVVEWYVGTDPLDNCPNFQGSNKSDAWPLDTNVDLFVTVAGDVFAYAGKIGAKVSAVAPGSWANRRLDLNQDDFLTVAGDVFLFAGKIGQSCA